MPDPYVDPERSHLEGTGIYIRARRPDGNWDSVDVLTLTKPSLLDWLRSQDNATTPDAGVKFRERVILAMLGHDP